MNREDIPYLWAYARSMWPDFYIPTEELAIRAALMAWVDLLGDFDADTVKAATAQQAAGGSPFPPKPGELRIACAKARAAAAGEQRPPSLDEAWAEVMQAVRFVGMYQTPEWTHPVVASAMKAFGWMDFCMSNDPPGVLRGQFRQFYEAAHVQFEADLAGPTRVELEYRESHKARALSEGPKGILTSPDDDQ